MTNPTPSSVPLAGKQDLIQINHVTKRFAKDLAINDLTFEFPKGKIVGLIGPSGCGKTTTVRLMTGIYHPTSGTINIFGTDPRDFTQKDRENIGYMTQLFSLYPDLTVAENMNFAASMYGEGWFSRRKRIRKLLEFVELTEHRHTLGHDISGGMLRRLSLAATLVHDPDLIFLDEPTASIDPILRRKFWDQFTELKNAGKTLLVTTQYVNEAAYCDLVGIMADGHMIMLETPDNLMQKALGGDVLDLKPHLPLTEDVLRELEGLPFVLKTQRLQDGILRMTVDESNTALPATMTWLSGRDIGVDTLEEYYPPYDDVFVKIIKDYQAQTEAQRVQLTMHEGA